MENKDELENVVDEKLKEEYIKQLELIEKIDEILEKIKSK